jgi:hypothetical protein
METSVTEFEEIQWQEAQARILSAKLAEKSQQIYSAWEISRLISTLKDGEFIGVEKSGQLFVGRNPKKVRKIGKIVPKHIPSNFDTADVFREVIRTTSFAKPAVIFGFKSSWETMLRDRKNYDVAVVELFLEHLQDILENRTEAEFDEVISHRTDVGPFGTKYVELSIKDWPVKVCFTEYGAARYFIFNGKKTEI